MGRLAFFCAVVLVLAAPWLRGGNRQLALAVLLTLGMSFLAAVVGNWTFTRLGSAFARRPAPAATEPAAATPRVAARSGVLFWPLLLLVVASPLWLAGLQLYSMDWSVWATLPGRAVYGQGLQAIGVPAPATLPLSLNPSATVASLWAGVPLAAGLLAGVLASPRQAWGLFGAMAVVVALQGVVTIAQYVQGPESFLYFDTSFPSPMIGTFNNRNHLADLFAMFVPIWFALLGYWRQDADERRPKVALFVIPLWYFLGFAVLVVLLATQSRGGVLAALVALVLSVVLHARAAASRLTWLHWFGLGTLMTLFGLLAVLTVGEDRVTERFAQAVLRSDAEIRALLARSTFDAALAFWPWGSGAGTFESVFPRFQNALSPGYASFAHNDYAQLLMEFGAAAMLLAVVLLVLVVVQLGRLGFAAHRQDGLTLAQRQQCFAGVGALAMLLHSWVEFNMHIPALAITAAVLLGVFLRPLPALARRD